MAHAVLHDRQRDPLLELAEAIIIAQPAWGQGEAEAGLILPHDRWRTPPEEQGQIDTVHIGGDCLRVFQKERNHSIAPLRARPLWSGALTRTYTAAGTRKRCRRRSNPPRRLAGHFRIGDKQHRCPHHIRMVAKCREILKRCAYYEDKDPALQRWCGCSLPRKV